MALTSRNMASRHVEEQLTPEQKSRRYQREVFKFYDREAEVPILQRGSIRLGSLQKYRLMENPALGDRDEGLRIARANNTFFSSGLPIERAVNPSSPMYSWVKENISDYARGDIFKHDIDFVETIDFYVYYFSYECCRTVVESLR